MNEAVVGKLTVPLTPQLQADCEERFPAIPLPVPAMERREGAVDFRERRCVGQVVLKVRLGCHALAEEILVNFSCALWLARLGGTGDGSAVDELTPALYDELHRIAARHLSGERPDHTLQATALVHEAYLKLFDGRQRRFADEVHFLAVASRIMRHVLVDYARARASYKRSGGADRNAQYATSLEVSSDRGTLTVDAPSQEWAYATNRGGVGFRQLRSDCGDNCAGNHMRIESILRSGIGTGWAAGPSGAVHAGETKLPEVADRLGIPIAAPRSVNPQRTSDLVKAGQVLLLPVGLDASGNAPSTGTAPSEETIPPSEPVLAGNSGSNGQDARAAATVARR